MARLALAVAILLAAPVLGQPTPLAPLDLDRVATLPPGVVGVAYEPVAGQLHVLTGGGGLYRLPPTVGAVPELVATADQHGAPVPTYGMSIDGAGTIYLVGSRRTETTNTGVVRRGRVEAGARVWSSVAETAPYPLGRTAFDHSLSAVAVSPDGTWLALNSGSRTDHGEVQDGEGAFPGVREVALTSAILRVPTDATDWVIPADSAALVSGAGLAAATFTPHRSPLGLVFVEPSPEPVVSCDALVLSWTDGEVDVPG